MRRRGRKNHVPHYPASSSDHPTVVILGRPNVGKSTLFNRMAGRTASIVKDEPGVTRDRIYAEADIADKTVTLVDTGGWEYSPENETEAGINSQCKKALEEGSLVLFIVDGRHPPTTGDYETAELLRKQEIPTILVVNKIDGPKQENDAAEMYSLGLENMVMVSAAHGRQFDVLEDMMYDFIPDSAKFENRLEAVDVEDTEQEDAEKEYATRVAVIGRPNAGKSSLINKLLNEDRLLTMDMPGTTRDAVDTHIRLSDGREYVFVDTAGIRRKNKVKKESPEHMAVSVAVNAMTKCRVVVLMIDADGEVAEQDAKILGLAVDRGRAVVIALNKWDLLKGDSEKQRAVKELLKQKIAFAPWAKTVTVSALDGRGVNKLLEAIDEANAAFSNRVPTGRLNALFDDIIMHHPPPLRKGRPVKLYFATQASVRPPTFVVQCSYPEALHFSYQRYVENRIRDAFGFEGTPLRMIFKKRARRGDK
ncbi:MAG: ribosome biogenesis GTPase Der [Deltaproteobacteria bacterium]|nr:ribosome biogenesis GTPase Der [Deltaproteobacteria bacterium]MBN2671066.1 ribosome biogenesis GTPase Der [Deltaproteobacteria bacterium]